MNNPRIRGTFVKTVYVPEVRKRDSLMSYPPHRNLVHFGSPEGTQYEKEESE